MIEHEPAIEFDEMLEQGVMQIARILSSKGYIVRMHAPTLLFHPTGQVEQEYRVDWSNPRIPHAQTKTAMVGATGLPQAMKFFTDAPTAQTDEILNPLSFSERKSQ